MTHTLYVDPTIGKHRYQLCVPVNESGVVQSDALACCDLDIDGRSVRAKEAGKNGVGFTLSDADVAAIQALVTAELSGKTMAGKGHIEFWVRDGEIEKDKKGTGPWFHYREKVAAAGLVPARDENRNPTLPTATIPYATIQAAAVDAVNAAIA